MPAPPTVMWRPALDRRQCCRRRTQRGRPDVIRQLDAIAAVFLRLVERPVGRRDHDQDVGAGRAARHADAHGRANSLIGHHQPGRFEGGAHAFRRHRRVVDGARQDGDKLLAPEATEDIGRPHVGGGHRREQLQRLVAGGMTKPVVDLLEEIEIERQHADLLAPPAEPLDELSRIGDEATPIQHAGQLIGKRRILVDANRALLREHQHHECGGDDVEHHLEREDRDPSAGQCDNPVVVRQHAGERNRTQEHQTVQHGHEDRRPAAYQMLAAFAPELGRGQERVRGHDHRAQHDPRHGRLDEFRHQAGGKPHRGANHHRAPEHRAAVKQPRRAPDHAACDEQHRVGGPGRQRRRNVRLDAPDDDRDTAEQIGDAPPSQRAHTILSPGEQQQHAKQARNADRDDEQRREVQRERNAGVEDGHEPFLGYTRWPIALFYIAVQNP